MKASWKKIVTAALAAGTLAAAAPFTVQADANFFLSNPAAGGSIPTASGGTCGTNSCVNFSARLSDVFVFGVLRRRLTLSTTPQNFGARVSTSIALPCTGGFVLAQSPGFVSSSGILDNLTATCPIGQGAQTAWGIVDAF